MTERLLDPGLYSVFVLIDDGRWEQPTYRVDELMPESELLEYAENQLGGFFSCGVGEDPDCPEDQARVIA